MWCNFALSHLRRAIVAPHTVWANGMIFFHILRQIYKFISRGRGLADNAVNAAIPIDLDVVLSSRLLLPFFLQQHSFSDCAILNMDAKGSFFGRNHNQSNLELQNSMYCTIYSGVIFNWELFIQTRMAYFDPILSLLAPSFLLGGKRPTGSSHLNKNFSIE